VGSRSEGSRSCNRQERNQASMDITRAIRRFAQFILRSAMAARYRFLARFMAPHSAVPSSVAAHLDQLTRLLAPFGSNCGKAEAATLSFAEA